MIRHITLALACASATLVPAQFASADAGSGTQDARRADTTTVEYIRNGNFAHGTKAWESNRRLRAVRLTTTNKAGRVRIPREAPKRTARASTRQVATVQATGRTVESTVAGATYVASVDLRTNSPVVGATLVVTE